MSANAHQSPEHFTKFELARKLATSFDAAMEPSKWKSLNGKVIGIGGPIGVGKTSLGSAIVFAFENQGHAVDFQAEAVNEKALALYIGGQQLNSDESRAPILYNRRFFDPKAMHQVQKQDRLLPARFENKQKNPYAMPFQMKMLSDCQYRVKSARTFVETNKTSESDQKICFSLVDRTPWDNTVFEEANRLMYGSISTKEHEFYRCTMGCAPAFGVDKLIYLECAPETTLNRIGCRGSPAEQAYASAYMIFLHDIWFHRIVEHHCVEPTSSSVVWRYFAENSEDYKEIPIRVVMWDTFGSIQDVLERAVDTNPPTVVYFYNKNDSDCPSTALNWDKLYARASLMQRETFKHSVLEKIANCEARIDFCFH